MFLEMSIEYAIFKEIDFLAVALKGKTSDPHVRSLVFGAPIGAGESRPP